MLSRVMASIFSGVVALDPITFVGLASTFATIAASASYIPAGYHAGLIGSVRAMPNQKDEITRCGTSRVILPVRRAHSTLGSCSANRPEAPMGDRRPCAAWQQPWMRLLQSACLDSVVFGLTRIISVLILRSPCRAIHPQQQRRRWPMAKCLSQSVPGFSASQGLPQRSPVMLKTARFPSICVSLAIAVVALPIRAAATPKAEPSSLDD
jgi:hypothetical protein